MSATNPQPLLVPVSNRRRLTDRGMRGLLLALTLLALVPLVLIIFYLLKEGLKAFSGSFFTTDSSVAHSFVLGAQKSGIGGIRAAILGSVEMVLIATVISVPLGVGAALYLTEYGKESQLARTTRYLIDVMTGVPSIVFGLFIYVLFVIGSGPAMWKGSLAIALLMLPIIARSAEVVLQLVPDHLREAALALGAPRWRVISKVVLPTAAPGLVTGVLLAIARGIGETAPVLFVATSGAFLATNLNPGAPTTALPLAVYNDIVTNATPQTTTPGWGAALTLVLLVLILNLVARLISRRSRLG